MKTTMPDDPPPAPEGPQDVAGVESARYDADLNRRVIVLETRFESVLPTLATKADIAGLRSEMRTSNAELRAEVHASNAELRAEVHASNAELRAEMRLANGLLRAELLTAMAALRADIAGMFTKMLISIIAIFVAFFLGIAGLLLSASNTMVAVSSARPPAEAPAKVLPAPRPPPQQTP